MKFLDLFAGIGGFRRGLERSGHACTGHVEIDKYANKSYMAMYELEACPYGADASLNFYNMCSQEVRKNCDGKTCKGEWYAKDIKQIRAGGIPKAEIWTFGFPCTDISLSGRMAGLHGERSGLFFTVIGLLKGTAPEDKPRYLIVENVKHLVSSEGGRAFTTVLFELWEAGYDSEWCVVNSKNFGIAHNRERVYIVGHLRNGCGGKIFPLGGANLTPVKRLIDGTQGNRVYDPGGASITLTASGGGFGGRTGLYAMPVSQKKGIAGELTQANTLTASDARGLNRSQSQNAILSRIPPCAAFIDLSREPKFTDSARCLMAKQNSGIGNFKGQTSGVFLCQGHPDCVRAVRTPDRRNGGRNGRQSKESDGSGLPPACLERRGILICCDEGGLPIREAKKDGYTMARHGDGINLAYPNSMVSRGRVGKQCAQTLLTGGSMGVMLCCRIRRLTPRECFRLQAFDDFLFDRARTAGISDAQLYKQAGNAVTVNVVYEIGLRLAQTGGSQ